MRFLIDFFFYLFVWFVMFGIFMCGIALVGYAVMGIAEALWPYVASFGFDPYESRVITGIIAVVLLAAVAMAASFAAETR